MVVPTIGTLIRFFFASSTPLRIASGTSPALPSPAPTWPAPSPTTIIALKLKRRPPLTTFATRLIWTTRSSSVSLLASMRGTGCSSEIQAGFASRVREGLDATVIPEAGPIEDHPAHAGCLGTLADEPADDGRFGRLRPGRRAQIRLQRGGGRERPSGRVVDHLGVDVIEAAE